MAEIIQGKAIVAGQAHGITLVSQEPLSFWGGYNHQSGEITDRRHPLSGQIAAGRILAVPFTRGSSTTSAVLLEAIRAGTAPAAIITTQVDTFFALAAIVAYEMYGLRLPVLVVPKEDYVLLKSGDRVQIDENGLVHFDGRVDIDGSD
jgi:predicted aconitase with swiveling domain